jgi:hypothetical protein
MFILMDIISIDPEERIKEPARDGRIAGIAMDDEERQNADDKVVAQALEGTECVKRPDDSIRVSVKEADVLLQDSLVSVAANPLVLLDPVWRFYGSGFVRSGSAWDIVSCAWIFARNCETVPGSFNSFSLSFGINGRRSPVMGTSLIETSKPSSSVLAGAIIS